MTPALKRANIERALESGRSVVGPWEVRYDGRGGRFHDGELKLYHYGHHLATVTVEGSQTSSAQTILRAMPREGHGFSRSDVEAIRLVASVTEATIKTPLKVNIRAYREYGTSRPFPLRPEPRYASGEY